MNLEGIFRRNNLAEIDRQWSDEAHRLRVTFNKKFNELDIDLAGDINGLLNFFVRARPDEVKVKLTSLIEEQSLDSRLLSDIKDALAPKDLARVTERVIQAMIEKATGVQKEKTDEQDEELKAAA